MSTNLTTGADEPRGVKLCEEWNARLRESKRERRHETRDADMRRSSSKRDRVSELWGCSKCVLFASGSAADDISRLQKKEDRNEMQSRRLRRRRQTAANRREIF